MARTDNLYELPKDLPALVADGACDHLLGMRLPSIPLLSTAGRRVDVAKLTGRTVVYSCPRTGRPDQEPPQGWNGIPGARGCMPMCWRLPRAQFTAHKGAETKKAFQHLVEQEGL